MSRLVTPIFLLALAGVAGGCTGIRQVSRSGFGAYEASLTVLPDGLAVAWYDTRDGNPEIYLRLLNSDGRPVSPEYRLTDDAGRSYEADVEVVDGRLAVAWYERSEPEAYGARLGLWGPDGLSRWVIPISSPGRNGRIPVLRTHGAEIFCAWLEDAGDRFEVWAGWWDLDGRPVDGPRRLGPAGPTTWNLNAAIDREGRAWIVYDALAGTREDELYLARMDREAIDLVPLTADDGFASKYPDLAFGSDGFALSWHDSRDGNEEIYFFVGSPEEVGQGIEARARRVTHTPGASIGAYLGWNGPRFGLAWSDNSAGQHEIYFQPFDSTGRPLRRARRITRNPTESLIPAIRPWKEGFALAWNEYRPGEDGVHGPGGRSEVVVSFVR